MMLETGKRYLMPDGTEIEVLRVTPCRALVRPTVKVHREVESLNGRLISFDKPANSYSISASSLLEEISA